MITFFKTILLGAFVGVYYGFVSYYLLSPNSMFSFPFLIAFGLKGAIFAFAFMSLGLILNKNGKAQETKVLLILNITKGAISGLLSGTINMYMNYTVRITHYNGVVPDKLIKMVISDLSKYSVGCILTGVFVGCLVAYVSSRKSVAIGSNRVGGPVEGIGDSLS